MTNGLERRKTGGSSLVQGPAPGAAGGTPGKRTLAEQQGPVQRKAEPGAPSLGKQSLIQRREESGGQAAQGTEQGGEAAPLDPRGTVINDLLESFRRIEVMVPSPSLGGSHGQAQGDGGARKIPVRVSIPYWNDKYRSGELPAPAGFDAGVSGSALGRLGISEEDAVAEGKGQPAEIADAATRAVELGLIVDPREARLEGDGRMVGWQSLIEAWLVRVGIGLDCSGFVYQALHAVWDQTEAQTTRDAGEGYGILDNYTDKEDGFTGASDEAMGGQEIQIGGKPAHLGVHVDAPDDLQVTDVMFVPGGTGHIRIIMQVDRSRQAEGITGFVTAESTEDGRYREGGAINGPRVHYWRYMDGALQHRYEGSPDTEESWQPSGESPEYRRHFARPPVAEPGTGGGGGGGGRGGGGGSGEILQSKAGGGAAASYNRPAHEWSQQQP